MTTYSEKLRHPLWQKKRLEILERDNWCCWLCSSKDKTLHVHHIFYDSGYENPWDYPNCFLITLCAICHKKEQQNYKIAVLDLQHAMARVGLTTADHIEYITKIILKAVKKGVWHG